MSGVRYRAALACGIACVLLVALFLGVSRSVHGEDAVAEEGGERSVSLPRHSRQRASRQGVSLQSTDALTVYLPLVFRDYPPPPPVFGVQMHTIADSHGLQEALAGGVHWVRYNAFPWDLIEPLRTNPPTHD